MKRSGSVARTLQVNKTGHLTHRITAVRKPPFKFSARTRVGFSDTDAQGVVYYGRYNPYFDLARVEYHRMLGLLDRNRDEGDFVMRANDVEYFAPARFDDELEIFVRVSRIGRTSITFEFGAYKIPDDTLMVTAHQTLVYVDLQERGAREVPPDYRGTVTAFEGGDAEQ
jgi:acyl-CoA thioester hydrolase